MRRQSLKMAVVGGAIALIVLFGIDMATSGIETINGPIDQSGGALPVNPNHYEEQAGLDEYTQTPRLENETGAKQQSTENVQSNQIPRQRVVDAQHGRSAEEIQRRLDEQYAAQSDDYERLPGIPDLRTDSSVNQLADGTAGMLQSISSKGIRFVVSFFESVTD
ncbi:hypothetical protein ACFPYJ_22205 [Paenibacillus solisilvae]|uniref:Uncharacterized protein n=1 Tax=Paenibacillus solisilvae TaxID=2486751 RepID=A0ABW0W0V0_9BACL